MYDLPSTIGIWDDQLANTSILIRPTFYAVENGGSINPPPPPTIVYLLQENGFALLNESGGFILLE